MNKKKSKFYIKHPGILAVSLIATLLLALAFSVHTAPIIGRRKAFSMLNDPAKRDKALNYIIQRTSADSDKFDPAMLEDSVDALDRTGGECFLQLAFALQTAGQWKQPTIPDASWLNWLDLLSKEKLVNARITAAQELSQSPQIIRYAGRAGATDANVVADSPFARPSGAQLLERLAQDEADDVRYNALIASAVALASHPDEPIVAKTMGLALVDKNPEISRQAWIFLGLAARDEARLPILRKVAESALKKMREQDIGPNLFIDVSGVPYKKPETNLPAFDAALAAATQAAATQPNPNDPRVFQALIWAQARLGVEWIAPPADILACKPPFTPAHAASLVYALAQNPSDENAALIASVLTPGPEVVNDRNYTMYWRAVLSLPLPALDAAATQPSTRAAALKPFLGTDPNSAPLRAIALSAGYRLGVRLPKLPELSEYWSQLTTLAAVESPRLSIRDLPINEWVGVPDVLRIMAINAVVSPSPDDLYPVFASDEPTIRDLACVVATSRFSPEQNAKLVRRALTDYNDNAKMTGAILAGLSGQSVAFLEERYNKEDQWLIKQVMGMGLWMQGKLPSMRDTAIGLLTRDDVPRSTLMLAMMKCDHPLGKEFLFAPRGEPILDLRELFDQKRWWPVMKNFLPADAPPFWIWADRELNQFQVDVLRNWYLIYGRDTKKQ